MVPSKLIATLAPYTSAALKDRFQLLLKGARSISIRYDEVKDWNVIEALIRHEGNGILFYEGEEWFLLELGRVSL